MRSLILTLAFMTLASCLSGNAAEASTRHQAPGAVRHYAVHHFKAVHVKKHRVVRYKRHHRVRAARGVLPRSNMISVSTAAGIDIIVAPQFASKIRGFIGDLVASGYKPPQIHCYSTGGHVSNSFHYQGLACDFNQRGWGLTDRPMYRVAALTRKWGLRDGCSFRDCGHIDMGTRLTKAETSNLYASVADWKDKR